jgi:hypothetical protein
MNIKLIFGMFFLFVMLIVIFDEWNEQDKNNKK